MLVDGLSLIAAETYVSDCCLEKWFEVTVAATELLLCSWDEESLEIIGQYCRRAQQMLYSVSLLQ